MNYNELCKKLIKNGFNAMFFSNEKEAVRQIIAEIPVDASIARCGSVTCTELGLFDLLKERGNEIIDPYLPGLSNEEKALERKRLKTANILLTGTNALTEDGKLVNIDGVGNRVSLQIFGTDKVIIVAGTNKVCKNTESAIKRIKSVACPLNARRLNLSTPCSKNIECPEDGCDSPDRMCRVTTIIERCPRLTPISIYLIDKQLGF
ncbi:MAG: lactate utilization protein [Candidatus Rifleibacteriota bacterium]